MYVCWLDEIEGFRFDVTHLPGSRNPTDPLSRCGFADGNRDGLPASTGDPDAESRQEFFSRLARRLTHGTGAACRGPGRLGDHLAGGGTIFAPIQGGGG